MKGGDNVRGFRFSERPGSVGSVVGCYVVPGAVHPLLARDKNPGYQRIYQAMQTVGTQIQESGAELILYFSSQWLSVLGYLFQTDPNPKWHLVDPNWHDLGTIHYDLKVDVEFSNQYLAEVQKLGHTVRAVSYRGFPVDPGIVVAEAILNPSARLPFSAASCNMYAEKDETLSIGQSALRAILKSGKKVAVVCVTGLSGRFHTEDVDFAKDRISSPKDDEWNRKILEILAEVRLDDVSEVAREYTKQANADMGFRGIWWLNGLCSKMNDFQASVLAYEPIYGSGAAVIAMKPRRAILEMPGLDGGEADLVERLIEPKSQRRVAVGPHEKMGAVIDQPIELFETVRGDSSSESLVNSKKAPKPVGPYPHARREGEFIFLSGVGPRKAGTSAIPGVERLNDGTYRHDVTLQTKSVIENVKNILQEAGATMADIIDIQVFLTNMDRDFKKFNEVYAQHFGGPNQPKPTRTTVEVGALPTPICVEFKVIARQAQKL